MTGKSVKDVDRYQAVLNSLLALEENKYCADCESKGPRWASWNLGIFVCIRCAGIHRNLGVHISKVKSVNLDQWTQEQVQCVQEMGNAKAKRLYEAFLPECFQRPETDQAAEIFIRDKYEKKKYMDKVIDIQMLRVKKSCDNIPKEPVVFEKMKLKLPLQFDNHPTNLTIIFPFKCKRNTLTFLYCRVPNSSIFYLCILMAFFLFFFINLGVFLSVQPASGSLPQSRVTASVPENLSLFMDPKPKAEEGAVKKLSKDSILSLYASTPSLHASGMATHGDMIGAQQNCMMGQQNGLMGAQGVMAQPSGVVATPYMTGMGQGMMGQQQSGMVLQQQNGALAAQQSGMMGQQQVGGMAPLPHQQMYGVQQGQQLQWNMAQVCMTQQVAGMNLYSTNGMAGNGSQHPGSSTAPSSTHMAAHVWK
uniref:Small ArfGAP2 n=1 Tax=Poecilia latipinna TaxID=48699 RepID=A0A3B3UZ22_9TELE